MKRNSAQRIDKKALLRQMLAEERGKAGLKQSDVSLKLGKMQSYISKIELGTRRIDVVEFIEVVQAIGLNPVKVLQEFVDLIERQQQSK